MRVTQDNVASLLKRDKEKIMECPCNLRGIDVMKPARIEL